MLGGTATAAIGQQQREAHQKYALQVDVDDRIKICLAHIQEVSALYDARVGDHDVDAAILHASAVASASQALHSLQSSAVKPYLVRRHNKSQSLAISCHLLHCEADELLHLVLAGHVAVRGRCDDTLQLQLLHSPAPLRTSTGLMHSIV